MPHGSTVRSPAFADRDRYIDGCCEEHYCDAAGSAHHERGRGRAQKALVECRRVGHASGPSPNGAWRQARPMSYISARGWFFRPDQASSRLPRVLLSPGELNEAR